MLVEDRIRQRVKYGPRDHNVIPKGEQSVEKGNWNHHPKFEALPNELRGLLNEEKFDFRELVAKYLDEIEIVVSNKFILDTPFGWPGVNLTITCGKFKIEHKDNIDSKLKKL